MNLHSLFILLAIEEDDNDPPVYIMVPMVGERSRRGAEDGNIVNLENVSYEVPTFIKFNESAKGDIEVSLIPNPENQVKQSAAPISNEFGFNGSSNSNYYCPPLNNKSLPMQPICLTLNVDNIFPPGKKIAVTNSSDIKGTGAILRIKFSESKAFDDCKPTTICAADLVGGGLDQALRQRLDTQKKRKVRHFFEFSLIFTSIKNIRN